MLETAINRLKQGDVTCVVVKEGKILHALSGMGIKPILTVLRQAPQDLQGASVADKVIGRAAATALISSEPLPSASISERISAATPRTPTNTPPPHSRDFVLSAGTSQVSLPVWPLTAKV